MTINTTSVSTGPYTGTNSTDTYAYDFKVQLASEVVVVETDLSGSQSTLIEGTNFSVTGVGGATGGTVVRTAGNLPTGYTWLITRVTSLTQDADFPGQGAFNPQSHENAFDKAMAIAQEAGGKSLLIDGSNAMLGDLDMGGFDINDAGAAHVGVAHVDSLYIGGILSSVTAFAGSNVAKTYANVAGMVAANDLIVGDTAVTQGYTTAGDGGHAAYRIVTAATGTDDGGSYHDLTGITGQAELIREDVVRVKVFGAVGDGVTEDTLAVRAAITYAGVDGSLIFRPGDVYMVSQVTPLEGQTWFGYGSTIKRTNIVTTTLTANKPAGTLGTILITSTVGFYIGMEISLASNTIPKDAVGSASELRTWPITAIDPGVSVTVQGGVSTKSYVTGDHILSAGDLIQGSTAVDRVKILGFTLDGNAANNTMIQRWEIGSNIRYSWNQSLVKDNILINAVADGLLVGGQGNQIIGNHILSPAGNGIHLSASNDTLIEGNYIDDVNNGGLNIGHTDGGVIASNSVYNTKVINNTITNCNGYTAIGSFLDSQNSELIITGNYIKDTIVNGVESRGWLEIQASADYNYRNIVTGNTVINGGMGKVVDTGTVIPSGDPVSGLFGTPITGNYFEKTGITIGGAAINLSGNTFFRVPDIDSYVLTTSALGCTVYVAPSSQYCQVKNNTFLDTDSSNAACIFVQGTADNLDIDGNSIKYYGEAIYVYNAGIRHPDKLRIANNRFENTIDLPITLIAMNTGDTGGTGMVVENNYFKIETADASSNALMSEAFFGAVIRNNYAEVTSDISFTCFKTNPDGKGSIVHSNTFILVKESTASMYAGFFNNDGDYCEYNYGTDNSPTGGVFRDFSPSSPAGATFTNNRLLAP